MWRSSEIAEALLILHRPTSTIGAAIFLLTTVQLSAPSHAAGSLGSKVTPHALEIASSAGIARTSSSAGGPPSTLSLVEVFGENLYTVVLFVAARCPYSNAYNARLRQLSRRFSHRGVAFVGVNSNATESVREIATHHRANNIPFPVLKDVDSTVASLFGATRAPQVFVVNQLGAIVYRGRIDENYRHPADVTSPDLHNALSALVNGIPLEVASTHAYGCSIRR